MLRGSAELLQKSARHFVPVVETVASTEPAFWRIDADTYTDSNIEQLLEQSRILRGAIGSLSDILVTKIMLGVYGCVPAFDTNFKSGFGVSTFGVKALRKVSIFYQQNAGSARSKVARFHQVLDGGRHVPGGETRGRGRPVLGRSELAAPASPSDDPAGRGSPGYASVTFGAGRRWVSR
jgi:hypothetical protein